MVVQDESTGAVHRNTGFRWLWASNALQETGRQFATLALSVTAVAVRGAEAWQVGVISALGLSAYLVIGLPAGVWVDRWPKRPVLVCTELIRAVAAASVAVAYIAGWLSVWQLVVVAAIISVTSVFSDTAQTAFTPAIVGPSRVSEAAARIQSTDTSMQVVGPALAAAVLTRLAAPLLYVITSVTGILAAVAASLIRAPEPREEGVAPPPFWASLVEGIAFVRRHPVLRTMLVTNAGLRAEVTPPQLMGRATAANRFITQGAMPLGALVAGIVGSAASNGVALLLSPLLLTLAAAAFALSPLRPHRALPDEWKHHLAA